jgi:hypothetical protein
LATLSIQRKRNNSASLAFSPPRVIRRLIVADALEEKLLFGGLLLPDVTEMIVRSFIYFSRLVVEAEMIGRNGSNGNEILNGG